MNPLSSYVFLAGDRPRTIRVSKIDEACRRCGRTIDQTPEQNAACRRQRAETCFACCLSTYEETCPRTPPVASIDEALKALILVSGQSSGANILVDGPQQALCRVGWLFGAPETGFSCMTAHETPVTGYWVGSGKTVKAAVEDLFRFVYTGLPAAMKLTEI